MISVSKKANEIKNISKRILKEELKKYAGLGPHEKLGLQAAKRKQGELILVDGGILDMVLRDEARKLTFCTPALGVM